MTRPYEARGALSVFRPRDRQGYETAAQEVMTAVNGFPYPGDGNSSIVHALAWLSTRPDLCQRLELSPPAASPSYPDASTGPSTNEDWPDPKRVWPIWATGHNRG